MDIGCATLRLCVSLHIMFPFFSSKYVIPPSLGPLSTSSLPSQAVVLFIAGKHVDAISRMDDLITDSTDLWADPALYIVQARETCPFV